MCVCVLYQQEEDLEAQVSFLQGQINDLEAMSKYCAKMMNAHICEFSTKYSIHSDRIQLVNLHLFKIGAFKCVWCFIHDRHFNSKGIVVIQI